jgi:hypothetical protein
MIAQFIGRVIQYHVDFFVAFGNAFQQKRKPVTAENRKNKGNVSVEFPFDIRAYL